MKIKIFKKKNKIFCPECFSKKRLSGRFYSAHPEVSRKSEIYFECKNCGATFNYVIGASIEV